MRLCHVRHCIVHCTCFLCCSEQINDDDDDDDDDLAPWLMDPAAVAVAGHWSNR